VRNLKRTLFFLLVIEAIFAFAVGLLTPIYALYVENIGGQLIDAGIAWSIAAFVHATLQYPAGLLADRFSKKSFMLILIFGNAIIYYSLIFINSVGQLFIAEFFIGLFTAIGTPAYDGLFSKNLEPQKESQQWGLWNTAYGYATAASALVGALIVTLFKFQGLFAITASLSFLAGIIVLIFIKEDDLGEIIMVRSVRRLFRHKHYPSRITTFERERRK